MHSEDAQPPRQAYWDRELQTLLNATADALVQSQALIRQSSVGLSQARGQNAQHRRLLDEMRQALSVPL